MALDLRADPAVLTAALIDIRSESRDEAAIADAVEAALREQTDGFEVVRDGNRVLAFGHPMFQAGEVYAPVASSVVQTVMPSSSQV